MDGQVEKTFVQTLSLESGVVVEEPKALSSSNLLTFKVPAASDSNAAPSGEAVVNQKVIIDLEEQKVSSMASKPLTALKVRKGGVTGYEVQ